MSSAFRVIDREIEPKQKCYIICTAYDPDDFSDRLDTLIRKADERGAKKLFFTCRDAQAEPDENGFTVSRHVFAFGTDFRILTKELTNVVPPRRPIRMKPLRESNAALYRDIFNEIFFDVPNSATVSESDTADMIENEKRTAGFLMEGGMPVGVFELDFSDAVPEIASVGIRPDLHGNGYGKAALTLLENDLIKRGYRTVKLLVAGTNLSALALYRTGGYRLESIHSRWYKTELPK